MLDRQALLERLGDEAETEVLIIGGGINGVGLFRDLAAQGVPALLVEQGDFCSGTSAAPSRLIHGGLRYLETGEFALVRESVEERNLLLLNAPHLVQPLCTWVPLTSWTAGALGALGRFLRLIRKPGRKGAVVVKLGLVFYDWFGRKQRTMPRHRLLGRGRALAALPLLSPAVRAVAEYYDARIVHPERLTLELVADAERDCPAAMALPYAAVTGRRGGTVLLEDRIGGRRLAVRPRLVVNMAGAWLDRVDALLGIEQRLIGGTKGSHLVLRHPDLYRALDGRMVYFETFDKRACLAYPLGPELVLLGTTDLRSDQPDDMTCSEEEIDYLFRVLSDLMPGVKLAREAIVFRFAGVRPLPRSDGLVAGAISRDHKLHDFPPDAERPFPVLSLVGGKWTTYRACAAQVADVVLQRLGRRRRGGTEGLPIGGGRDWPGDAAARQALLAALARDKGLTPARAAQLFARYGTAARAMTLGGDRPLPDLPGYSWEEIAWLCQTERVTRLADLVLRRTLIAFDNLATKAAVEALAEVAGAALGWEAGRRAEEVAETLDLLRRRHGVPGLDGPERMAWGAA